MDRMKERKGKGREGKGREGKERIKWNKRGLKGGKRREQWKNGP